MLIGELIEKLKLMQNSIFPGKLQMTYPSKGYHVKSKWFSGDESQIPNAGKNGVYIYTKPDDEILYIGKGAYSSTGGIGCRSCAHLGKAQRDSEVIFPNHQWVNDNDVDPAIKSIIERGDFHIWTVPIEPKYFVPLVEVYLQTAYFDMNKGNPLLNRRIG